MSSPLYSSIAQAINAALAAGAASRPPLQTISVAPVTVSQSGESEGRSPSDSVDVPPPSPAPSSRSLSSLDSLDSLPALVYPEDSSSADEDTASVVVPDDSGLHVATDGMIVRLPSGADMGQSPRDPRLPYYNRAYAVLSPLPDAAPASDASSIAPTSSSIARIDDDGDTSMANGLELVRQRRSPGAPPSYLEVLRNILRSRERAGAPTSPFVPEIGRNWRIRSAIGDPFTLPVSSVHDVLNFLSLNHALTSRALSDLQPYELSALRAGLVALHDRLVALRRSSPSPPQLVITWVHRHSSHRHGIDYCINPEHAWVRDIDVPLYRNGPRAIDRYWRSTSRTGRPHLTPAEIAQLRVFAPQYHGDSGRFLDTVPQAAGAGNRVRHGRQLRANMTRRPRLSVEGSNCRRCSKDLESQL